MAPTAGPDQLARTIHRGNLSSIKKETDGALFVPGFSVNVISGTWTLTRDATGQYKLRRTAAASAHRVAFCLTELFMSKIGADPNLDVFQVPYPSRTFAGTASDVVHDIRGLQVVSIDVIYNISVAAINTAHTAALGRSLYANNAAVVNTTPSTLTGSLATATQGSPYVTNLTLGTALVLGNNVADTIEWLEILVDDTGGGTAVYDLIGIMFYCNYNFL